MVVPRFVPLFFLAFYDDDLRIIDEIRDEEADLDAYLQKVSLVGHQIAGRQFYKRPGKWCGQCDYLPICLATRSEPARRS